MFAVTGKCKEIPANLYLKSPHICDFLDLGFPRGGP